MNIFVMPSDVFNPRKVDEEFSWQADQIREAGGTIALVDLESLSDKDRPASFKNLQDSGISAYYRGWMLSLTHYSKLDVSLRSKGVSLVTSMPDYQRAHHLPGWYETFKPFTPASLWFSPNQGSNMPSTTDLNALRSHAFIVKDYVKSRKHEWDTACFAPSRDKLNDVINEFIRLQTEDNSMVGGVIVRAFEEFDKDAGEARVWWVDGNPVLITAHPDTPHLIPDVDSLYLGYIQQAVQQLGLSFVTTDLALRKDGHWRVIEVGDGQVSGLPHDIDASLLWKALIS